MINVGTLFTVETKILDVQIRNWCCRIASKNMSRFNGLLLSIFAPQFFSTQMCSKCLYFIGICMASVHMIYTRTQTQHDRRHTLTHTRAHAHTLTRTHASASTVKTQADKQTLKYWLKCNSVQNSRSISIAYTQHILHDIFGLIHCTVQTPMERKTKPKVDANQSL